MKTPSEGAAMNPPPPKTEPPTRLAMTLTLITTLLLTPLALLHAAPQRPNVVMLLSDDLGFKDIGCYDGPVKTPALDGLATRGTRFTDFYSGCAVCSPSRATLLTGRHHIRAGVYSWIDDKSQRSHLREREVTLAEVLKPSGYATAHVGKWHLGLPTPERRKPTPADHSFDYWFATGNNAIPSHLNPTNFIRNGEPVGEMKGYSCQIVVGKEGERGTGALSCSARSTNKRACPPFSPLSRPQYVPDEFYMDYNAFGLIYKSPDKRRTRHEERNKA